VIHNEIGSLIYRQYISKAIQKGPMGAEDTQFLTSIKEALGMETERCEELIRDVQLNYVSMLVESMFEKAEVLADDVRKMRDSADLYDIDLVADLQINSAKLDRMFNTELDDLIETGELTPADTSPLTDLCEPLHIDEARAQAFIEAMAQKRADSGLLQAAADMRQGSTKIAAEALDRVLRFVSLVEDVEAKSPAVSAQERSDLYLLYQAHLLSNEDAESEAKLALLKSVMKMA